MEPERIPNIARHSIFDEDSIIEEHPVGFGSSTRMRREHRITFHIKDVTLLIWKHKCTKWNFCMERTLKKS